MDSPGAQNYNMGLSADPAPAARNPSPLHWCLGTNVKIELAGARKLRERNKVAYRLAHWPIWIWVFFLAPGPLTFQLFAYGFDRAMAAWLGAVLLATGIAGLRGR